MQNPTNSETSMYHPTIYWVEPNISFSQSPPCHIPSMNVEITTKPIRDSSGFNIYPTKGFLGPKPSSILLGFTIILPRDSQTQKKKHTLPGFAAIPLSREHYAYIRMDASRSLHLNREEFVYLHLYALPHIPPFTGRGFLGPTRLHPLGFTVYPTIHWQRIPRPNKGMQDVALSQSHLHRSMDSQALCFSPKTNPLSFENHSEIQLSQKKRTPSQHDNPKMARRG